MKILLDENLPKRLKNDLVEFETYTVFDKGWSGLTNGILLQKLISERFDALITFDKNLRFQQNFKKYSIAVIVLNIPDNTYQSILDIMPKIKKTLNTDLKPGPIILEI